MATKPVADVSHEAPATSTVNVPADAGTTAVSDHRVATVGSTLATTLPPLSRTLSRASRFVAGGGVVTVILVSPPAGVTRKVSTSPPTPIMPLWAPADTGVAPAVVLAWSSVRIPPRVPILSKSSSVLLADVYCPLDHWVTARLYGAPMIGPQTSWPP